MKVQIYITWLKILIGRTEKETFYFVVFTSLNFIKRTVSPVISMIKESGDSDMLFICNLRKEISKQEKE